MKRSFLVNLLMLVTIAVILSSIILMILFSGIRNTGEEATTEEPVFGIVPIEDIAEKLTLEQLVERLEFLNTTIYLPTLLGDLKLTTVYYKPPVAILVYSNRGITNLDYCNATIEISLMSFNKFSKDELEQVAKQDNKTSTLNINGNWAMLIEGAESGRYWLKEPYNIVDVAYFVLDDHHYYLLTVKHPLGVKELIEIAQSMRPLKQYLIATGGT